jgi:hypothetical protein
VLSSKCTVSRSMGPVCTNLAFSFTIKYKAIKALREIPVTQSLFHMDPKHSQATVLK